MKNLIILCLLLAPFQASFAQAEVEESFKVSESSYVDFKLTNASDIKIETWDKSEVNILAKVVLGKQSDAEGFAIDVEKKGNKFMVHSTLDYNKLPSQIIEQDENGEINLDGISGSVEFKNGAWHTISYDLVYEIKVPEYLAIDLCTNRANVEVKGVNAPMEIVTRNGFIDVARSSSGKANVKLTTNSGEIFTDFDINYDGSKKKRNTCEAIKIEAAINGGGGDDISLTSTCGNIYLRKEK